MTPTQTPKTQTGFRSSLLFLFSSLSFGFNIYITHLREEDHWHTHTPLFWHVLLLSRKILEKDHLLLFSPSSSSFSFSSSFLRFFQAPTKASPLALSLSLDRSGQTEDWLIKGSKITNTLLPLLLSLFPCSRRRHQRCGRERKRRARSLLCYLFFSLSFGLGYPPSHFCLFVFPPFLVPKIRILFPPITKHQKTNTCTKNPQTQRQISHHPLSSSFSSSVSIYRHTCIPSSIPASLPPSLPLLTTIPHQRRPEQRRLGRRPTLRRRNAGIHTHNPQPPLLPLPPSLLRRRRQRLQRLRRGRGQGRGRRRRRRRNMM